MTSFPNQAAPSAKALTRTHQGPLGPAELTKDPARSELYARAGKRITRSPIDGYLPVEGDCYPLKTFTRLIQ